MDITNLVSYIEETIENYNYMYIPHLDERMKLLSAEELQQLNSQLAEKGVMHKLIEQRQPCEIDFWIFLLQYGYEITREDCRVLNAIGWESYKWRATQLRLAHRLYEQNRGDLIPQLFLNKNGVINTAFVLEALEKDYPQYFNYRNNPWQNIANNAIQNYKRHWPFIEAAYKKHNKWEQIVANESFRKKHEQLDLADIMKQMALDEYTIFRLAYPDLEVPELLPDTDRMNEEPDIHQLANRLFCETELSRTLYSLCLNVEKQQMPWGFKDIQGESAEDKIYSLWRTHSQREFYGAMFKLAGGDRGYTLLNCLVGFLDGDEKAFIEQLHSADILSMFQIGLESGRIYNQPFLMKVWEMGYRHYTNKSWNDCKRTNPLVSARLFCLDNLSGSHIPDNLLESEMLRIICMIESIKTNELFFTDTPNWKAYINGVRGSRPERLLNRFWGYIDIALDVYRHTGGMTMREYLKKKEPGIRLEKCISPEEDIEFIQVLKVLYPEVYA